MMEIKPSSLKSTKPHEYVQRFVLGGLVTAIAGLIAEHYGPTIGGLFLAFPAIFPAAATMIETHEREKKEQAGLPPGKRGREAAGVDAGGAALATIGLATFALILWRALPSFPPTLVLVTACLAWIIVSAGLLWLRRRL